MVTIRKASIEDRADIASFQIAMALETENLALEPEVVDKGVMAVFEDASKGFYYVAETGGKVVGSLLTTYEWSDWRNGNILWIQSVYVKPEFRGKGIFRMLYERVKCIVMDGQNKYRGIRLYVDKTNERARRIYEKLGMTNHHYETFEWMKY